MRSSAEECVLIDRTTGIVTRGPTLQASKIVSGEYGSWVGSEKYIRIRFKEHDGYGKKRLLGEIPYLYVASTGYSLSGMLPAGSSAIGYADGWGGVTTFWSDSNSSAISYARMGEPSYVDFTDLLCFGPPENPMLSNQREEIYAGIGTTGNVYSGVNYYMTSYMSIHSDTGVNPPYVIRKYEDVVPRVYNVYPTSGFVDENQDVAFSWTFTWDRHNVRDELRQAQAKFRWRPKGSDAYEEVIIDGSASSYVLPANSITTEEIEWQVVVTSDDGISSAEDVWYTLTTIDSVPDQPTGLYPKAVYSDGALPIVFSWVHVVDTGTPQSQADLQYSLDSGKSWVLLGTTVGPGETFTAPAGTIPAGTVQWRVRTYNSDGAVGEWSQIAQFIVRAAPVAPSISSVTSSPRPTVQWQSVGQQAYQVRVGDHDSGTLYGSTKTYKPTVYLPDGPATVQVRIQNNFGLWSPWTSAGVTVENRAIPGITAQAVVRGGEVKITWTDVQAEAYYVIRDGVPIARINGMEYTDCLAHGVHIYQVRGVIGDNYSLSNKVTQRAIPDHSVIGIISDDVDWLSLRLKPDQTNAVSVGTMADAIYQHYEGRRLPVAEVSGFANRSHTMAAAFLTQADLEKLLSMVGKLVVYKDKREKYIGVLDSVTHAIGSLYVTASMGITAVDYTEEVPYV